MRGAGRVQADRPATDLPSEDAAHAVGEPLLQLAARDLQGLSRADFLVIAEPTGDNLDRLRVVAMQTPAGPEPSTTYQLAGTPCEDALYAGFCAYPDHVQHEFPRDPWLVQFDIRGYCGLRLADDDDRTVGVLAALHKRPLSAADIQQTRRAMLGWSRRLAAELASRRDRRELQAVLNVVRSKDEVGLTDTCRLVAEALGVAGTFVIGRDARTGAFCTDALVYKDRVLAPVELEAAELDVQVNQDALDRIPWHPLIRRTGAEAIYCLRLERHRRTVGALGVLDDRPFLGQLTKSPTLEVFARRVYLELFRREVEEERAKAERVLARAERDYGLDLMVGGIAHDLRNLIQSAEMNVECVLASPDKDREALEDTDLALTRAAALIERMLDYCSDRSRMAVVDLVAMVSDTHRLVRAALPRHCHLNIRATREQRVFTDATQLQRVLLNLVTNAARALEGPGHIWIEIDESDPPADEQAIIPYRGPTPRAVRLKVEDDGVGMAPDVLPRIFDPYFSRHSEGRGIGLASARRILVDLGVGLAVRSEPGKGSCFELYFASSLSSAPDSRRLGGASPGS